MRKSRGFTYVEITMVAGSVALMFAIAVPNYAESQVRAQVSRTRAEISALMSALEDYRVDHRIYPPNREPGVSNGWDLVALTTPVAYISSLPLDVFTIAPAPVYGYGVRLGEPGPQPYAYLNAMQVDEAGFKDTGKQLQGFVGALLWGHGPDRKSSPLEKSEGIVTPYDPTNGTFSGGDIYGRIP